MVGEGEVAVCAMSADVADMLVLHTEEAPHEAAEDFGEREQEGEECRVLDASREDDVEDPRAAENGVNEHGQIVRPGDLIPEAVAKERVFGGGIEKRPVHDNIPDSGVH